MRQTGYAHGSYGATYNMSSLVEGEAVLMVRIGTGITDDEMNVIIEWHTAMTNGRQSFDVSSALHYYIPETIDREEIIHALQEAYSYLETDVTTHRWGYTTATNFIPANQKDYTENEIRLVIEAIESYKNLPKK